MPPAAASHVGSTPRLAEDVVRLVPVFPPATREGVSSVPALNIGVGALGLLSLCILQENLFLKVHMGEKPVLPCQFKNNKGEAMKIGAFVVAAGLLLPAAASLAGQSSLAGDELPQGDQRQDRLSQHLGV